MITYSKNLGVQCHKDYIRSVMPHFEFKKENPTPQIKDHKFYTSTNIWNNPSRLSPKSKKLLNIQNSKTQASQKSLKELQKSVEQQNIQEKTNHINQTKFQDRSRSATRRYQLALIQQECHQIIDEKQLKELEEMQVTPEQQKKFIIKTNTRPYVAKMPENFWNNLEQKDKKFCKIIWTDLVVKREEQAIQLIKNKIEEEKIVEEMKQKSIQKNQQEIRNQFLQRHINNIELEKQIKIGVFGVNEQIEGKLVRKPLIPESAQNEAFPVRYKAKLELQQTLDTNTRYQKGHSAHEPSKGKSQIVDKSKKSIQQNDSCDLNEFRGLTIADCNENFIIKNENVANQLINVNRVKRIREKIQRPSTSNNHVFLRKEVAPEQRMKGFDETRSEKSLNLEKIEPEPEQNEEKAIIFQDMDNFEKTIEQKKNKNGFCKISVKENEMLSSAEGFFKMKQLQQKSTYPYCLNHEKINVKK